MTVTSSFAIERREIFRTTEGPAFHMYGEGFTVHHSDGIGFTHASCVLCGWHTDWQASDELEVERGVRRLKAHGCPGIQLLIFDNI